MAIKILINRSNVPAIPSGTLVNWNGDQGDLTYSIGSYPIEGIVVDGNTAYKNRRKLTLYITEPFEHLSFAKNRVRS